ncbi:hypothetical protein J1N35_012464 [Gossypium stocksii]|uniref:BHLH domain-containing protein n=1 Tax=Gossypium stocksii TaxID=47602 RepID=A0A9D3W4L2_9ROSI|nr:hypothetical protein J1N35_012464 [Gossypium stocksii]
METADYYYLQQNQQQSCGLMRYRSMPAENRVGFDEYGSDFRSSSSSEMETLFMLCGNGSAGNVSEYEEKSVKQEEEMMYQIQSLPLENVESSFGVGTNLGLENSMQRNGNGSNLVRQTSSPSQFFSSHGLDNGFTATRKMTTLRACNGINGEPTSTGRLYNHISFSSGPMPQVAQVENEGLASNANGRNGMNFIPNLMTDSRNNASLSGLKRARERDSDLLSGLSRLQTRNQDCRDCSTALTHHLSLPTTYEEMDVWQFQSSVPCKIRAKRGCATHPRSIAERMRRTRISERMRKLQGLFPNIDKQTNTADMLDMAVEYIKDLQKQVKILRDTKAKCSC